MIVDLPVWAALIISVLLVVAGFFALTGSLGLLRLQDFYSRIHAPTLANTLASFCLVVSILIMASFVQHRFVVHSLLVSFFLIITSPVTAMLLMRAAIKRNLRRRNGVDIHAPSLPAQVETAIDNTEGGEPVTKQP